MEDSQQPEHRPAQPPAMRASDADRERVARILHDAMAEGRLDIAELDERLSTLYAAKTQNELVPLTADLPAAQPDQRHGPPRPVPAESELPSRRFTTEAPTGTASVAIMSGADRKGAWVLPERYTAFALMGGIELDLTDARFTAKETVINVVAIMAGVDIRVPEDVTVRVEGIGIMGAYDNHAGSGQAPHGAPVVRITGMALMGGVEVKPPKRKRNRRELER